MVNDYCPNNKKHLFTAEQLLRHKYGGLGNYPRNSVFVTIVFDGGFEQYGAYEDWRAGWIVRLHCLTKRAHPTLEWMGQQFKFLDKPLVVSNHCLTCATERVLKLAEELELE